jgi:phototropin
MHTAAGMDPADSLSRYGSDVRRRSSPVISSIAFKSLNAPPASHTKPMLSPPPTPRSPPRVRPNKLSLRLRSNSGLSLHTNDDALRQYIDYNEDGSPRTPLFSPVVWRPEGIPSIDSISSGGTLSTASSHPLSIPDFFGREIFQMVLNNPQTRGRLRKYAKNYGLAESIDFLVKVCPY